MTTATAHETETIIRKHLKSVMVDMREAQEREKHNPQGRNAKARAKATGDTYLAVYLVACDLIGTTKTKILAADIDRDIAWEETT